MDVEECKARRELANAVSAVITELSKPGISASARAEAVRQLTDFRAAYWKHVAEHGCKDPADRLKAIHPKTKV